MFTRTLLIGIVILIIESISNCHGVPVGGSCNKDEDCDDYPESTICDPIICICYCNDGNIPVQGQDGLTCEPIRMEFGQPCKVTDQCTLGVPGNLSTCVPAFNDPREHTCNCTEEAVHKPGQHVCIPERNFIGDACEVDLQCKAKLGNLSYCITGLCSCYAEAVGNHNGTFCLPIVNVIGGQCEESQQCRLGKPGMFSDCVDSFHNPNIKVCTCISGAKPEPGENECLKPNGNIGEMCELDRDCVGNPGISSACCNLGKCLCLGGYLPSGQMDDCLVIRNGLGESCVES